MSSTPQKTLRRVSDNATISSPRKIPRLDQASGTIVPRKSPARRRLFAAEDEMDTGGNDLFVQRLLDELAEEQKLKWGFDFERGEPLPDSNFIYQRVSAEQVPGFYRCFSMGVGIREAGSAPSTIPSDWVYPGVAQAHNEQVDGEDAENVNPQLLRLEEVEESFANDTTSSSSASFTSTLSPINKGNITALGCIDSSTSVIKESEELASGPSKRIFKTPTSRKPSRISDALPNRKHLQRSAKKLDLTSPKSVRKSVAPSTITRSPTSKRATVSRRHSLLLTVGSRLAAAGHSRCSEMENRAS